MGKSKTNRAKSTLIKRVNSINAYLDFGQIPNSVTIIECCNMYCPNQTRELLKEVKEKMTSIIMSM